MNNDHLTWQHTSVTRDERERRNGNRSCVLWLTGLSGAGKSTLANAIDETLFNIGYRSYVLDGDNIRHGLNADLDFSSEGRTENIRRVGEVARLFVDAGQIVVTAFISPFREDRDRVRARFTPGEFVEIWCDCSLTICEERDVKGLYKKARAGLIGDFTGISSPYEAPLTPEVHLNTADLSAEACVAQVMQYLRARGFLPAAEVPAGATKPEQSLITP